MLGVWRKFWVPYVFKDEPAMTGLAGWTGVYRTLALSAVRLAAWSLVLLPVASVPAAFGQGILLPSIGPVNQSFGGAAAACPIDAASALYWNPATISGLQSSEMTFGLGMVLPTTSIDSEIAAGSFGPGVPPIALSGSTDSEPGICAVPTIGFTHRAPGSPWTIGLGIFGIGGFSANYPASTTNPIFTPQPPGGLGLGQVNAKAELYQIAPVVSYAVSEQLSIGIGPTMTLAHLAVDPLFLAPPNDANGDGFFTYGPGTGTRTAFGGGFQLGTYYITDIGWHLGVAYKSPQWFEPLRYNSTDELGAPVHAKFNFDLPSILSFGAAFTGFDGWVLATDIRYIDYANADGFGQTGFNPDGSLAGLGWRSVMSVSQGIQYELTPWLTLRTGYSFNQNPISDSQAMPNVASTLIIQHWYSLGATYRWTQNVSSTIAYSHGFENTVTGPYQTPAGPVPGTSVTDRVRADILNFGVTVNW
jgi:long-chain fatty acid transport protein